MVSGREVRIDPQSAVRVDELFVCVDVCNAATHATARLISHAQRQWLDPRLVRTTCETFFNPSRAQVESRRRVYFIDLLLSDTPAAIEDPEEAARILVRHAARDLPRVLPPLDHSSQQFRRRVQWLGQLRPELGLPPLDDAMVRDNLAILAMGRSSIKELCAADWLGFFQQLVGRERLYEIEQLAPAQWLAPSGTRIDVRYEPGRPPALAVRIQEIFGLSQTPRIAGGRVPVNLELLGPNYRPQQITNDLDSFWSETYPQIRKELRRRYPKHSWPDDPIAAKPTRSGLSRDAH
jgi:ATP-dependent helicase HrpB